MGIDEAGEESGVEILGSSWPVFSSEFGVVEISSSVSCSVVSDFL